MKTYEKLTNLEREKLAAYQRYSIIHNMFFIVMSVLSIAIMLVGWSIVMLFENWSLVCVGGYLVFSGFMILIISFLFMIKRKKELFLIFGYKDSISGVFEVTDSDVKKVKIERREIWRVE